jgi:hypothetical protein
MQPAASRPLPGRRTRARARRSAFRAAAVALLVTVAPLCLATRTALATPRPLPFTYTTETLDEGEFEVEQYADLTPVRAISPNGDPVWFASTQFQTEFEYGITDRLELGLYMVVAPAPGAYSFLPPTTETTGIKERLRYTFAEPGEWPIDVGLYGELAEGATESEIELKILLQRRLGRLRMDANLWGEYELYYVPQKDIVLNPTVGATYEILPSLQVGAESWLRVEFPNPAPATRPFALGPAVYVGPTMLLSLGKLWWSVGVYGRASRVNHVMEPGEPYGPLWTRVVVGIEF